jgi:nuclear protein localization family protein 4
VNEVDGFELLDDENDKLADALAAGIGMTRVGWIFTDLHVDPALKAPANVSFTRDMSDTTTVFTAGELLQAAYLQSQRPNIVSRKYCSEGNFGSKFVSVVMSGDKDNFAAPTAFQASNEAVAMAKADILAPSTTAANEMLVQLSDDTRYVPEIYYTHKNEYNKEVKSSASPSFPSDYLMCDMQAAFVSDALVL